MELEEDTDKYEMKIEIDFLMCFEIFLMIACNKIFIPSTFSVVLEQVEKSEELKPEKLKDGTDKQQDKTGNKKDAGDDPTGEAGVEVDGETVVTANVPRGTESSYHTRY